MLLTSTGGVQYKVLDAPVKRHYSLCLTMIKVMRTRGGYTVKYGLNPRDFRWVKPKGNSKGAAQGKFQGLKKYFTVHSGLSPNTDIVPLHIV